MCLDASEYYLMKISFLTLLVTISTFNSLFSQQNSIGKDTLLVFYDTGSHVISIEQEKQLKGYLSDQKPLKITVVGYADYVGSTNSNNELALKRAKYLQEFLLQRELADTIIISTKGEMPKPKYFNETEGNSNDRKSVCYLSYSNNLIFRKEVSITEVDSLVSSSNNIELIRKLQVGESTVLINILFYLGKAVIIPSSFPELQTLHDVLVDNPNLKIEIKGHVCCGVVYEDTEGNPSPIQSDYNMTLSLNRASAIKNYLVVKGIHSDRVLVKGMGFLEPLYYPEKNESHRQLNRRIELIVLEK